MAPTLVSFLSSHLRWLRLETYLSIRLKSHNWSYNYSRGGFWNFNQLSFFFCSTLLENWKKRKIDQHQNTTAVTDRSPARPAYVVNLCVRFVSYVCPGVTYISGRPWGSCCPAGPWQTGCPPPPGSASCCRRNRIADGAGSCRSPPPGPRTSWRSSPCCRARSWGGNRHSVTWNQPAGYHKWARNITNAYDFVFLCNGKYHRRETVVFCGSV